MNKNKKQKIWVLRLLQCMRVRELYGCVLFVCEPWPFLGALGMTCNFGASNMPPASSLFLSLIPHRLLYSVIEARRFLVCFLSSPFILVLSYYLLLFTSPSSVESTKNFLRMACMHSFVHSQC